MLGRCRIISKRAKSFASLRIIEILVCGKRSAAKPSSLPSHFPTLPKCSHPPHHPFDNPCELTLHSINRILSKHIVELNEAESSRRLGHVRNTLWSVRRRCTLHCVIARQDSAARRRCAVVPLLQRHISDMPFIEAAFAHSAPQFSELERTMCFAHLQVSRLVFTALYSPFEPQNVFHHLSATNRKNTLFDLFRFVRF